MKIDCHLLYKNARFLYLNSLPWLRPVSHNWLDENLFDSEDILKLMVKELKAKAVIPRNPRNKQKGEFYFKQRRLYCPADIPMMKKEK